LIKDEDIISVLKQIEDHIKDEGLGFGSSGASVVAALKSANELLGNPLSEQDLIDVASIGEVASAGSPHPDNVSASMLGGFVAVVNRKPVRAIRIPTSLNLNS